MHQKKNFFNSEGNKYGIKKEFSILYYGLESCLNYLKKIYKQSKKSSSLSLEIIASYLEMSPKSSTVRFIIKSLKDFQLVNIDGSTITGKIFISELGLHYLNNTKGDKNKLLNDIVFKSLICRFYFTKRPQGEYIADQALIRELEKNYRFSEKSIKTTLKALRATYSFIETNFFDEKINSNSLEASKESNPLIVTESTYKETAKKENILSDGQVDDQSWKQLRWYDDNDIEHRIMAAGKINYQSVAGFINYLIQSNNNSYPFKN